MDPLHRPVKPVWRRKKRRPLSEEIQNMYRLLSVTLIILAVASTAAYLYSSSQQSAKGYTLKQLQIEHETLSSQNRSINHQIINAQSFIEIEQSDILEVMQDPEDDDLSFAEDSPYAQAQTQ